MNRSPNRRTATKVKDGRVQRKNRSTLSTHSRIELYRRPPGKGFRHVVSKEDVQTFIALIPDWEKYSVGLERIVLVCGDGESDGYYQFWEREGTGGIFLQAWPEEMWVKFSRAHYDYHPQLEVLGVAAEVQGKDVHCRFTEAQARAFLLLHVFMHELGHHCQRMNSKHHSTNQDEDFAEGFANRRFWDLLPAYVKAFGNPSHSPG